MYQKILVSLLIPILLAACSDTGQSVETDTGSQADTESVQPEQSLSAEAEAAAELAAKLAAEKEAAAEQLTMAEDSRLAGEAFLHINARKPGVKVMESGLQFEIIESGSGRTPKLTSTVLAHYHGTLTDGEVFDSSIERGEPASFPVNRLIKGWTEALQMMKEGDIWRLVIPPHLAYGERGTGQGRIPPHAVLVFELELIEVTD